MRLFLACLIGVSVGLQQAPPQPPPPTGGVGGPTQGRGAPPPPARPTQRSSLAKIRSATGDALDRYLTGDYSRAIAVLQTVGGFEVTHAETWILDDGDAAVPRRRLAAALVALEYTAARPGMSPGLIEWGAKVMRQVPTGRFADPVRERPASPHSAEGIWLRASVALAEGRHAWALLTGPPSSLTAAAPPSTDPPDPLTGNGHLSYAISRRPGDAHLLLAKAVGAEVSTGRGGDLLLSSSATQTPLTDRLEADGIEWSGSRAKHTQLLELAAGVLEPLVSHPEVGGEAHLRLGYIQLRLGQRARALEHLDAVPATTREDFARYLSHFFAAWTHGREGRSQIAIDRYRAALGIVPRARSASTLLAAELMRAGRMGEAEALVDEFFSKPPEGGDPWKWYLLGDYRAYQGLIERMRELIQ
jgi:tetratricopeptide (TPR) repeat protein